MIAYKTILTTGTLSLLCTSPLLAQSDERLNSEHSPWSIELGIGVENEPVYTGSNVSVTDADANFEISYSTNAGHEYFLSLGEIGARWNLGHDRKLSTLFEYEPGRDNSEDSALDNFPEVDDTVEFQAVYQQPIGPITLGIGAQYDIKSTGKGTVGFLGVAHQRSLSDKLGMQVQLDLSFADATHMAVEVGISPETAAITGYNAYDPDSGYKGASFSVGLQYALSPKLLIGSEIALEHYGSIMSDSALISEEGTATTYEASLGIRYLVR